jgi:hypothetical protein
MAHVLGFKARVMEWWSDGNAERREALVRF